jgi:hypothetical protein
MFDEPLLNSLQGTMATIDPMKIKKEEIDSYRLDEIEMKVKVLERRFDDLIMALKLEFYEGNKGEQK